MNKSKDGRGGIYMHGRLGRETPHVKSLCTILVLQAQRFQTHRHSRRSILDARHARSSLQFERQRNRFQDPEA